MKPLLLVLLSVALTSCATMKNVARTVDDIAVIACELFGTDHPREFELHVRSVMPAGSSDLESADKVGFLPQVLCDVKEVLQPFIDDQLRLQQSTAARLSGN